MSRKVSLLLLFLAYALVLVHSIMPHEHLHQETTAAKPHSHDNHHHSHEEEERHAAGDNENPFSHYFHSLAQGEPHFSGKEEFSFLEASKEAKAEEHVFEFNPISYYAVPSSKVYETDFHSPPDSHHFSRRGPPLA